MDRMYFKAYLKIILSLIVFLIFDDIILGGGFIPRLHVYIYSLIYILYFLYLSMKKKDRNKIFELSIDLLFLLLLIVYLFYFVFFVLQGNPEADFGLFIIFFELPMFMLALAYIGADIARINKVFSFCLYLKIIEVPMLLFSFFMIIADEYFLSKYLTISMWLMISYFIIYFIYMIYTAIAQKNRNNIFELGMELFFISRLVLEVICYVITIIIPNKSSFSYEFVVLFEIPMFIIAVFYLICDIVRIRKERKANVC